jgi:hypothetical protein
MAPPAERLDSWKAIAAYLRRDERTVRRWEKSLGLPVRRVPGARGSSVFALTGEIDAWLQSTPTAQVTSTPDAPPTVARRPRSQWIAGVTAVIVVAAIVWGLRRGVAAGPLRYEVTAESVIARDANARERWRVSFPTDERALTPAIRSWVPSDGGANGLYVLFGNRQRVLDDRSLGGELQSIGPDGAVRWRSFFDDQYQFPDKRYGPPWHAPSFRLDDRADARRVAVALHHDEDYPGLAIVFDEKGRRTGTFINAGWIEDVHWIEPDRLLINGYAQERGGMVAMLDPHAMNGQSPFVDGEKYFCRNCGADRPLRYIVFPPSELHQITNSHFNRARVVVHDDRIMARTEEFLMPDQSAIDALYEFSPTLEFQRAYFSDRYWDLHRSLEAEGKVHHTREHCPDRDGPQTVLIWEPNAGWKVIHPSQDAAR